MKITVFISIATRNGLRKSSFFILFQNKKKDIFHFISAKLKAHTVPADTQTEVCRNLLGKTAATPIIESSGKPLIITKRQQTCKYICNKNIREKLLVSHGYLRARFPGGSVPTPLSSKRFINSVASSNAQLSVANDDSGSLKYVPLIAMGL